MVNGDTVVNDYAFRELELLTRAIYARSAEDIVSVSRSCQSLISKLRDAGNDGNPAHPAKSFGLRLHGPCILTPT